MGQKSNPIGLRLQINRTWDSRWYAEGRNYQQMLKEDLAIRKFIIDPVVGVVTLAGAFALLGLAILQTRATQSALKDASDALREGPKKRKRKGGLLRKVVFLMVAAGIAVAVSEDLRNKVLDALFGKEEEFDYTSSTQPSTPAPQPAGASS